MSRRKLARVSTVDFKDEVHRWAQRIGVEPNGVYVQLMTKKWGSCSVGGRVCFNRDLLREPHEFQTLVIVHELIHLQVYNHGKLFRGLIGSFVPGWRSIVAHSQIHLCSSSED